MRKTSLRTIGRFGPGVLLALWPLVFFSGCGHYAFFQPAKGQPHHLREEAAREAIFAHRYEDVWAAAIRHLNVVDGKMRKRWDDVDSRLWTDKSTGLMVYTAILNRKQPEVFVFVVHILFLTDVDRRSTRILYSFKKQGYSGPRGGYADWTSMSENPAENLTAIASRLEGRDEGR